MSPRRARPVEAAIRDGRRWLDPLEVVAVMAAYAIPTVPTLLARDADEAGAVARPFLAAGTPVVVKILSRDIVHKSDIGGVRLNLASEAAVRTAAAEIIAPRAGRAARRAHRRRHRPADDRAPEGARAHRRHRRRSDLRSGHRLRRRRNGGRGDRRQGAGAAAARPQDGERPDRAHADFAHRSRATATCRPSRRRTSP